jgi:hypothetical protein
MHAAADCPGWTPLQIQGRIFWNLGFGGAYQPVGFKEAVLAALPLGPFLVKKSSLDAIFPDTRHLRDMRIGVAGGLLGAARAGGKSFG